MSYRRKEKNHSLPLYEDGSEDVGSPDKVHFTPRKGSIRNKFSYNFKFLGIIVIFWIMLIHYFERIVPGQTMKSCQWGKWEHWETGSNPHRVALVADPQIIDDHTYPKNSRLFNYIVTLISDNYLRRNHKFMHSILDPDTTLFLGDLFDGGREWDDYDVWFDEYKRFSEIFPEPINRRTIKSIPGNHDIGYQTIKPAIRSRFQAFFGDSNDFIEIGNHTIVMMDTISLSHPDEKISREAREFLSLLNEKSNTQLPRILLTHVPLYRFTDQELCGPLREKGDPFPLQSGLQYQTVVDYQVSQDLLRIISPEIVFSGDDHDYCHINHHFQNAEGMNQVAEEISCKTASMTCGVQYPAIQLLSLYNPYDPNPKSPKGKQQKSYQTEMCYLPLPYLALKIYVVSLIISICLLSLVYVFPSTLVRVINKYSNLKLLKFLKNSMDLERNVLAFWLNLITLLATVYSLFAFYYWYI